MTDENGVQWIESEYANWRDALLLDESLSQVARLFYLILDVLARQRGAQGVADPSLSEVRAIIGCSENTLRAAVKELVADDLLTVKRRGQGLTSLYTIHPRSRPSGDEGLSRGRAHGLSSKERDQDQDQKQDSQSSQISVRHPVPKLLKIDGRNLGFDAVAEESGIVEGSPRMREIPAALNGGRTGPGIREQYWREACDHYGADKLVEMVSADPERFERGLEAAIHKRAAAYHAAMPGVTLTPPALQKWWSDLPTMLTKRADGDLVARMRAEAQRLREEGN